MGCIGYIRYIGVCTGYKAHASGVYGENRVLGSRGLGSEVQGLGSQVMEARAAASICTCACKAPDKNRSGWVLRLVKEPVSEDIWVAIQGLGFSLGFI